MLDLSPDTHTAYGLVNKLHAALPALADQRNLGTIIVLSSLEKALADRTPALNQYASKPGANASSVVEDLLTELANARASGGPPSAPSGGPSPSGVAIVPLSELAFDDATNKSASFNAMSARLQAQPLVTAQDRIDAMAIGFDGTCIIAVRALSSTSPTGDADARKHPILRILNGLRPVRHDYFNYMLKVDPSTGIVPTKLDNYHFATQSDQSLMEAFLNRRYRAMDWFSAPRGVHGFDMHDSGKTVASSCHHLDRYCQPALIKKLGKFGHKLFKAYGTPATADPSLGFTFDTLCDRFVAHLEIATRLSSVDEQVKWLREAGDLFEEILDDIATWINLALAAPDIAGQDLTARPLVGVNDPAMQKN